MRRPAVAVTIERTSSHRRPENDVVTGVITDAIAELREVAAIA
jgi:hypothetical protein